MDSGTSAMVTNLASRVITLLARVALWTIAAPVCMYYRAARYVLRKLLSPWSSLTDEAQPVPGVQIPILKRRSTWANIKDLFSTNSSDKSRLLLWVQHKIPEQNVQNFSTSWMDGLAICTLMNALYPDSCPLGTLKSKHKIGNCRLGLYIAEKILDIPEKIITPQEMVLQDDDAEANIYRLITLIKWAWSREKNTGMEDIDSTYSSADSSGQHSPPHPSLLQKRRVSFSFNSDHKCNCAGLNFEGHCCRRINVVPQDSEVNNNHDAPAQTDPGIDGPGHQHTINNFLSIPGIEQDQNASVSADVDIIFGSTSTPECTRYKDSINDSGYTNDSSDEQSPSGTTLRTSISNPQSPDGHRKSALKRHPSVPITPLSNDSGIEPSEHPLASANRIKSKSTERSHINDLIQRQLKDMNTFGESSMIRHSTPDRSRAEEQTEDSLSSKQALMFGFSNLQREEKDQRFSSDEELDFTAGRHLKPRPEKCRILAVSLDSGVVGEKKNFQVNTTSAGHGYLNVEIIGLNLTNHSVHELHVTYIGDNIYDVVFDVIKPATYCIHVTWDGCHVQDSPFTCQMKLE